MSHSKELQKVPVSSAKHEEHKVPEGEPKSIRKPHETLEALLRKSYIHPIVSFTTILYYHPHPKSHSSLTETMTHDDDS